MPQGCFKRKGWNMKKQISWLSKIIFSMGALILFFVQPLNVSAASASFSDDANVVDSHEKEVIESTLNQIKNQFDCDIFIKFTKSNGRSDAQQSDSDNAARDGYERIVANNYPDGAIGLVVDYRDRSYYWHATGKYAGLFKGNFNSNMEDEISDLLKEKEPGKAAQKFLYNVKAQLDIRQGNGFQKRFYYYPTTSWIAVGVSVGVGVIASIAGTIFIYVAQHRQKKEQEQADLYGREFVLTQESDQFIRSYQTRVARERSSSSRGSGGSGGGTGGHF